MYANQWVWIFDTEIDYCWYCVAEYLDVLATHGDTKKTKTKKVHKDDGMNGEDDWINEKDLATVSMSLIVNFVYWHFKFQSNH